MKVEKMLDFSRFWILGGGTICFSRNDIYRQFARRSHCPAPGTLFRSGAGNVERVDSSFAHGICQIMARMIPNLQKKLKNEVRSRNVFYDQRNDVDTNPFEPIRTRSQSRYVVENRDQSWNEAIFRRYEAKVRGGNIF